MLTRFLNRSPACALRYSNNVIQNVRFQSSTKNTNLNQLSKSDLTTKGTKVKKSKSNKSEYNALSNQNLAASQNEKSTKDIQSVSSKKPIVKKVRKTAYSVPQVPSTTYWTSEHLAIDSFYAGHRPLAMSSLKSSLLPRKSKWPYQRYGTPWSVSASGLESFAEWNEVEEVEVEKLLPFHPPTTEKVTWINENEDGLDRSLHSVVHHTSREETLPLKKKSIRGRKQPSAVSLVKRKKLFRKK